MFNIACFLSIKIWKILKSGWLTELLATCRNSEKTNIYSNVLLHNQTRRQRDDWTDRKQKFHIPAYYTQVQINKELNLAKPGAITSSLMFFGRIPKHFDTQFKLF